MIFLEKGHEEHKEGFDNPLENLHLTGCYANYRNEKEKEKRRRKKKKKKKKIRSCILLRKRDPRNERPAIRFVFVWGAHS